MTLPLTLTLPALYGWDGITAFVGILVSSIYKSFITIGANVERGTITNASSTRPMSATATMLDPVVVGRSSPANSEGKPTQGERVPGVGPAPAPPAAGRTTDGPAFVRPQGLAQQCSNAIAVADRTAAPTACTTAPARRPAQTPGALCIASRILHTRDYTTGDPKRRVVGAEVGAVANPGLLGTAGHTLQSAQSGRQQRISL
ncbi:hypothetical protein V8E36_006832 [Tilletia maclaganii]